MLGIDVQHRAHGQALEEREARVLVAVVGDVVPAVLAVTILEGVLHVLLVGIAVQHRLLLSADHGGTVGVADVHHGAVSLLEGHGDRGGVTEVDGKGLRAIDVVADGDIAQCLDDLSHGLALSVGDKRLYGPRLARWQQMGHGDGGTADALAAILVHDGDGGRGAWQLLQRQDDLVVLVAHGDNQRVGLRVGHGQLRLQADGAAHRLALEATLQHAAAQQEAAVSAQPCGGVAVGVGVLVASLHGELQRVRGLQAVEHGGHVLLAHDDVVHAAHLGTALRAQHEVVDGVHGQVAEHIFVAAADEQAAHLTRAHIGQFQVHVLILGDESFIVGFRQLDAEVGVVAIHGHDGEVFPAIGLLIEGQGLGRHAHHHVLAVEEGVLHALLMVFVVAVAIVVPVVIDAQCGRHEGKDAEHLQVCAAKASAVDLLHRRRHHHLGQRQVLEVVPVRAERLHVGAAEVEEG